MTLGKSRCGLGVLLGVLLCALQPTRADEAAQDPLPIRRVLIDPAQPPKAFNKQGALVPLSRKEFEAKVDKARAAKAALQNPPRLLEAHYRAQLVNDDLVGVTTGQEPAGEWKIINPGKSAGILPLDPLNLAIRTVRLPTRAVLGDLDGKTLGLLVEQPGEQALEFDWSARGTASPGVLRFDIQVPACPVATLELNLPADRIVLPRETFLLSGPHKGPSDDRRLWHIDFAGHVQLEIREGGGPQQPAPLVLSRVRARQDLEPDLVRARFEFELEVPHQGLRDIRFDCDPGLIPYDVEVRNLETWEVKPDGENKPSTLLVRLRKPFQEGTLSLPITVRCLATLPADKLWNCPTMRAHAALNRGENLILRVHPDVHLEDWDAGGFQFQPLGREGGASSPGWQVFRLNSIGIAAGTQQKRPSARLRHRSAAYQVKQRSWWRIEPNDSTLTSDIDYQVLHGKLFRLPLIVPPGWNVEDVELEPASALLNWASVREKGQGRLIVVLKQPLTPAAKPTRLRVTLKPADGRVPLGGARFPFPDLEPVDAHLREGVLGISVAPLYLAEAEASLQPTGKEEVGPWGATPPGFVYAYRGLPVTGVLALTPRRPRIEARCKTRVSLRPARAELATELTLRPRVGEPRFIDVSISAPVQGEWRWQLEGNNQVRRVRRLQPREVAPGLAFLGATNVFSAAALAAAPPNTTQWYRIALAEPLREPLVLRGTQTFPTRAAGKKLRWTVPLLAVDQADPLEGEVILHLDGVKASPTVMRGLWEGPGGKRGASSPWRAYRYSQPGVQLELEGKPSHQVPDTAAGPFIEQAELTTSVDPAGRLLSHLRFRVWNWRQRTLPVMLPPGARCVAAVTDDSWIEQLPAPVATDEGVRFELPIAGPGAHEVEIVYEVKVPEWKLWCEVAAPLPGLPARVLSLRRIWRLPPGMTPLKRADYQRLPDVNHREGAGLFDRDYPAADASVARLGAMAGVHLPRAQTAPRVHPSQLAAVTMSEKTQGRGRTLGESLAHVAQTMPDRPGLVLVVDAQALRRRELTPLTPIYPKQDVLKTWADQRLTCLPCGAAFLLTTDQQLDAWLGSAGSLEAVVASLEGSVADAVASGHDPSGRFRSVLDWLRVEENVRPGNGQALERLDFGTHWVAWEPRADRIEEAGLAVVRQDLFPTLGLVLAVLLGWISWRGRGWPRWLRGSLLWCWIALAGIALFWLPETAQRLAWYPLLIGLLVALMTYLRSAPMRRGVALLLLVGVWTTLAPPSHSQKAKSKDYVVYLLPSDKDTPQKQNVLAPPDLLDRLDRIAKQTPGGMTGAILVGASYMGKVNDTSADIDARFEVHCFSEGKATVNIPLGADKPINERVNLKEGFLNGKKVSVLALPERAGFAVEVDRSGRHEIVLRFQVKVSAAGDDRALAFAIPELAESRLELQVQPGARSLYVSAGRGRQVVAPELKPADPADKPLRLEADLGRLRNLQVRWRHDARPQHGALEVDEAYLWKLHPSASSLFAVLQYELKEGAATVFALDLPALLDVRSVEAASLPGAAATEALPRLVDWSIQGEGNQRQLVVVFQHPITTGVQLGLEFVPRGPLGASLILPLPTPRNARTSDGYLAYRSDGIVTNRTQNLRVTGYRPEDFGRIWKATGMPDPGADVLAFTFDRVKGPPIVRLDLSVTRPRTACVQALDWSIGARQANLEIKARVTSSDRDLLLLEWELPEAIRGVEVAGGDVRSWSRNGGRLQVWLTRPVLATELKITGWQQLDDLKRKPPTPIGRRLRLQTVRLRGASSQTTYLNLNAEIGLALDVKSTQNLYPLPTTEPRPRAREFATGRDSFEGLVEVKPAPVRAEISSLSFVELVEDAVTFRAVIDCRLQRADQRAFTVTVRDWDGPIKLETPAGIEQRPGPQQNARQMWTVTLPDRPDAEYRLRLVGKMPANKRGPLVMPDVSVSGATRLERWVAVAGRELRFENPRGLEPVHDVPRALAAWPAEAERIRRAGAAWKVDAPDWRLLLIPTEPALAADFRLFADEQSAALLDGKRWLHQAAYILYHETGADLAIDLPRDAQLLSVRVDGDEVSRIQVSPQRLWLPLSSRTGAFTLQLHWSYPDGKESVARPLLDEPKLAGARAAVRLMTVHVPPGFRASVGSEYQSDAGRHASLRAEQLLELSALLGRMPAGRARTEQLTAAQVGFHQALRRAAQALGASDKTLADLRKRNEQLALELDFDALRIRAEDQVHSERRDGNAGIDAHLLEMRGTPTYLTLGADAKTPRLSLASARSEQVARKLEATVFYLLLLAACAALVCWPRSRALLHRFWPEQMIVLGCLGWITLGPAWFFVFLVVLGLCGRLVIVLISLWRLAIRFGVASAR